MGDSSREEPFEDLIKELGYDNIDQEDGTEHVLVYRGNPDRECTVCGKDIPGDSREMQEGDQYLILREKPEDKPFPLVEKTYHINCYEESNSSE